MSIRQALLIGFLIVAPRPVIAQTLTDDAASIAASISTASPGVNRGLPTPGGTSNAVLSVTQAEQDPGQDSARRQGFIIGIGGGAGVHRPPSFLVFDRFGRVVSSGGGGNTLSIGTDFSVGYAAGDRLLLYYSNKAAFTGDDQVDAIGVTGFGTTYMFRRTSPTPFVGGSIGVGVAGSFIASSSSESGAGFSATGGYEFARHFSLSGDAIFVRLGSGGNHTVIRGSFNYLFY
jgi:hypothetical protein